MSEWKNKRFWTDADVAPVDAGFEVHLDGRQVKTPLKNVLCVPSRPLAEAIADEWRAQSDEIDPLSMPATRYANAAIEKVALQRADVADMLASYGETDLLCYRALQPDELIARQAAAWDPMLDWADQTFSARLNVGNGVMFVEQDPAALANLSAAVHALSVFEVAALHDLVCISGSLILGLAAARGSYPLDTLWTRSRIDEEWQIEQWGRDEEADALMETKCLAFENAAQFFEWVKN